MVNEKCKTNNSNLIFFPSPSSQSLTWVNSRSPEPAEVVAVLAHSTLNTLSNPYSLCSLHRLGRGIQQPSQLAVLICPLGDSHLALVLRSLGDNGLRSDLRDRTPGLLRLIHRLQRLEVQSDWLLQGGGHRLDRLGR